MREEEKNEEENDELLINPTFVSQETRTVKRWGDKAKDAIKDKLNMLIKERVFVEVKKPMEDQIGRVLMIHCFVIEKRDGRIKA